MQSDGYLHVKHMLEYISEVQAEGAESCHQMTGVEVDVRTYVYLAV